MNTLKTQLACLALALGTGHALASSTAASSASEGGSASVGSVSDSFEASSGSSSKKNKQAAAGDYKVVDMAAAPERPGILRLTLQPLNETDADQALVLYVPEQALARSPLAAGEVVSARTRPYGVEFAKADTGRAFFLVLQDDWYRELQAKAVAL